MTGLTPDEYAAVLAARRDEHARAHPHRPGFPPLLEWFIRDGDEDLVDMAAINAANARADDPAARSPRTYRPASYWRDRLARIDTRLAALNGTTRHDTTDPAAYGGIGIRQTRRQARRYGERIDRVAAEHVRLEGARRDVAAKLARAEARETRTAPPNSSTGDPPTLEGRNRM